MVEILNWYVVELLPAFHASTTLIRPVEGLLIRVFLHGSIARVPIYTIRNAFDVGISQDVISIRSTLRETFAKRHAAIRKPAKVTLGVDQRANHLSH
jgi:hypothetical protein